jgi:hypothetical protein
VLVSVNPLSRTLCLNHITKFLVCYISVLTEQIYTFTFYFMTEMCCVLSTYLCVWHPNPTTASKPPQLVHVISYSEYWHINLYFILLTLVTSYCVDGHRTPWMSQSDLILILLWLKSCIKALWFIQAQNAKHKKHYVRLSRCLQNNN